MGWYEKELLKSEVENQRTTAGLVNFTKAVKVSEANDM